MNEIRKNLYLAQDKVDEVLAALNDVTGGYSEMKVKHVGYLMATLGEFGVEDAQGVYDAIDAALEEMDRLERELRVVKMELAVLGEG